MANQLPKIDRWHSEPLDIHRWSDHPEIKTLCNHLYADANLETLEPKGNRKAHRNVKDSLRVLILDLFVRWLKDSTLSIGLSNYVEAAPTSDVKTHTYRFDGESEQCSYLKQQPRSRGLSVVTIKYTTTSITKDIFKTDRIISKNAQLLSVSGSKSALHRFM